MTDPKQMPDLLPCPFCGGVTLYVGPAETGGISVICETCSSEGPPTLKYDDDSRAIEGWNRRADLVPMVDVEGLLAAVRDMSYDDTCPLCWDGTEPSHKAVDLDLVCALIREHLGVQQ